MTQMNQFFRLTPRVQEMLKDSMQKQERKISAHQGSDEGSEEEEESDGDQRMYCSCRQVSTFVLDLHLF